MTITRHDILSAASEILEDNRPLDPDLRAAWNEASVFLDEVLSALGSEKGGGDDGIDTLINIREREEYQLALLNAGHLAADITKAQDAAMALRLWDDPEERARRLEEAEDRVTVLMEKTGRYPQNVQHLFEGL
mgnify:CR=1 FL=1